MQTETEDKPESEPGTKTNIGFDPGPETETETATGYEQTGIHTQLEIQPEGDSQTEILNTFLELSYS